MRVNTKSSKHHMKILHYTENFYAPSETFIFDIIKSTQHKYTVEVLTHYKLVDDIDLQIHDVSLRNKSWLYRKFKNIFNQLKGRSHNTNLKKARDIIKVFSPDVVHCHFGTAAFYFDSIQRFSATDIPQVISLHGFDVFMKDDLFFWDYCLFFYHSNSSG